MRLVSASQVERSEEDLTNESHCVSDGPHSRLVGPHDRHPILRDLRRWTFWVSHSANSTASFYDELYRTIRRDQRIKGSPVLFQINQQNRNWVTPLEARVSSVENDVGLAPKLVQNVEL